MILNTINKKKPALTRVQRPAPSFWPFDPKTKCRPNGTLRYWSGLECYRRRQTTTDTREHH